MIELAAIVFGVLGIAFGLRCYLELWRWARQCQNAKIAIAHNRRVQINAPLSEWLAWANQLTRDEASTGRVVYRNNKVSVAILRPKNESSLRAALRRVRKRGKTTAAVT